MWHFLVAGLLIVVPFLIGKIVSYSVEVYETPSPTSTVEATPRSRVAYETAVPLATRIPTKAVKTVVVTPTPYGEYKLNTKPTVTCTIYYPCSNQSYTYSQVYPENCTRMQESARNACNSATTTNPFDVSDAVKKMQEISGVEYTLPTAQPIDGTIHMEPTSTPSVPVGYP